MLLGLLMQRVNWDGFGADIKNDKSEKVRADKMMLCNIYLFYKCKSIDSKNLNVAFG